MNLLEIECGGHQARSFNQFVQINLMNDDGMCSWERINCCSGLIGDGLGERSHRKIIMFSNNLELIRVHSYFSIR